MGNDATTHLISISINNLRISHNISISLSCSNWQLNDLFALAQTLEVVVEEINIESGLQEST